MLSTRGEVEKGLGEVWWWNGGNPTQCPAEGVCARGVQRPRDDSWTSNKAGICGGEYQRAMNKGCLSGGAPPPSPCMCLVLVCVKCAAGIPRRNARVFLLWWTSSPERDSGSGSGGQRYQEREQACPYVQEVAVLRARTAEMAHLQKRCRQARIGFPLFSIPYLPGHGAVRGSAGSVVVVPLFKLAFFSALHSAPLRGQSPMERWGRFWGVGHVHRREGWGVWGVGQRAEMTGAPRVVQRGLAACYPQRGWVTGVYLQSSIREGGWSTT